MHTSTVVVCLPITDRQASFAFYRDGLGFEPVGEPAEDGIPEPLQFTLNEIGNWVDADQSTGRIVHIPNGRVFSEPVANYDKGFSYIWHEVPVLVVFDQSREDLCEGLMGEAVDRPGGIAAPGALFPAGRRTTHSRENRRRGPRGSSPRE